MADGAAQVFARHALARREAPGLAVFGDATHKIPSVTGVHIPEGVDGEQVRGLPLTDFGVEIGSSFGPLKGKIWRPTTTNRGVLDNALPLRNDDGRSIGSLAVT